MHFDLHSTHHPWKRYLVSVPSLSVLFRLVGVIWAETPYLETRVPAARVGLKDGSLAALLARLLLASLW